MELQELLSNPAAVGPLAAFGALLARGFLAWLLRRFKKRLVLPVQAATPAPPANHVPPHEDVPWNFHPHDKK